MTRAVRASSRALVALSLLATASGCGPDRLQAVELRSHSLQRELLAHWAFDDAVGSVARDDSGNGRHGALTGGTWLSSGRFAGALHLGEGEFVSVQRFPDATSSFTVSAWVRLPPGAPASADKWTTIVSTENSGGWELNVAHPDLGLHFGFWKGPGTGDYEGHSCAGAPLDRWSQVAGVSDTAMSTFSVYRDGKLCFSATTEHKILPGSAVLMIGQWPSGGRFLVGDVDDIAIWGRALEAAEVELLTQTNVPSSLEPDK